MARASFFFGSYCLKHKGARRQRFFVGVFQRVSSASQIFLAGSHRQKSMLLCRGQCFFGWGIAEQLWSTRCIFGIWWGQCFLLYSRGSLEYEVHRRAFVGVSGSHRESYLSCAETAETCACIYVWRGPWACMYMLSCVCVHLTS